MSLTGNTIYYTAEQTLRDVAISYTEAGKAISFALEQTLCDAALTCSTLGILKRLEHTSIDYGKKIIEI